MPELRMTIDAPELGALLAATTTIQNALVRLEGNMADAQQLLNDLRSLAQEIPARLDAIDDALERARAEARQNQVSQDAIDAASQEVATMRQRLATVNPDDPSGDDPAPVAA